MVELLAVTNTWSGFLHRRKPNPGLPKKKRDTSKSKRSIQEARSSTRAVSLLKNQSVAGVHSRQDSLATSRLVCLGYLLHHDEI